MEMREDGHLVYRDGEHKDKYAKKGVANTALGLGIAGTALWLLGGGLGNMGGLGCANKAAACGGPTTFQAWQKECEDNIALTSAIYNGRIVQMNERFNDRQTINTEMFGLYKSQIDADFSLYKGQRDNFDILNNKISALETQVAVSNAVRPYQDKLIMCEIADSRKDARYDLDRRTCRMITGELVLPSTPTVTGFPSFNRCCGNAPVVEAA